MKKFILFLFIAFNLNAQEVELSYYLPKDVTYKSDIPKPATILGHEVGAWHVSHDKMVSYFEALAKASDRISLSYQGKTFEEKPLLLLTVTSEKNHKNIDKIRKDHIAATNDETIDVSNHPIVVFQGYTIHGNEPSGMHAAILYAYYLAAAEGIDDLLENVVMLIDPCMNPDGYDRFAFWVNTNKSKNLNPDPNDREFAEIWPRGRTNHYQFDMNRDWMPAQMPESKARIATFHKWLPNILTDHHEMGSNSTYFFQPGIPSRTNPMTSQLNQDLTKEIATYHASAFDKIGSTYYTEESFDDYYYGKGSTFPDINGGIGILFEQGSSRGHAQETLNGVLTFPFTIKNQFTASLSTVEAAKNMRVKILKYQQDFYKKSRDMANKKAIVFGDEKDAAKAFHLAEILKNHKIKVHEIKSDFIEQGKRFKKGYSYMVLMNQKNHRFVEAMFDVRTTFQDSLFYDVSAWTFNHAFNVDFARNVSLSKAGSEIQDLQLNEGTVTTKSTYGYLMPWNEYYAPKALNAILQKGLRAKVAMKNFANAGKSYDYGTIFIPVQNQVLNVNEMHAFLSEVSAKSHLTIHGVDTGLNEGIDLGSNNFRAVTNPKVAMLVGDGIAGNDSGEIWHLFDQRFDMNITRIDTRYLNRVDLTKYTHLIIPSGRVDRSAVEKVKLWTKSGGVVIGYKNTSRWLASSKMIDIAFDSHKFDRIEDVSFEERSLQSGAQVIGGAIFEAKLDRSHPVNFGYKNDRMALFRNSTIFIKPNKRSYNNPIQYTSNPLLSGYISKENAKVIQNTVPFQVQRFGSGRVAVFTDNTNFRAFWYGTNKLLMNTVFFADKM